MNPPCPPPEKLPPNLVGPIIFNDAARLIPSPRPITTRLPHASSERRWRKASHYVQTKGSHRRLAGLETEITPEQSPYRVRIRARNDPGSQGSPFISGFPGVVYSTPRSLHDRSRPPCSIVFDNTCGSNGGEPMERQNPGSRWPMEGRSSASTSARNAMARSSLREWRRAPAVVSRFVRFAPAVNWEWPAIPRATLVNDIQSCP